MAGYSGTGTAKKLGIKQGCALILVDAPDGWSIDDLPAGVTPRLVSANESTASGTAGSVVVAFFRTAAAYAAALDGLAASVFPDGAIWAAWPRRAAGHVSDLGDGVIRSGALAIGLVDVKVAAIDEDWSGLRIVWKKENRVAR
jgi:hypothetical protein